MCRSASSPVTVSTTRPRSSAQSQRLSLCMMSTVLRGSRRRFLHRCRSGSVLMSTYSPSVSTQVGWACGCPSGSKVTTIARFLPLASLMVYSSIGTDMTAPFSVNGAACAHVLGVQCKCGPGAAAGPVEQVGTWLPAAPGGRVHFVRGDLENDPAVGADGVGVVAAHVLAGELVDVLPGLIPRDGVHDVPTHLRPVVRVVTGVNEHGDARVPGQV